jgi:hypothetical protein
MMGGNDTRSAAADLTLRQAGPVVRSSIQP